MWCKSCEVCTKSKSSALKGKSPLKIYNVGAPFERIQMDILGPLSLTSFKNKFLLVVVDCFSKWPEAFPLRNKKARTIAEVFINNVQIWCSIGITY